MMISPPSSSLQLNIFAQDQFQNSSDIQPKIDNSSLEDSRQCTFFPEYITRSCGAWLKPLSTISPECLEKNSPDNKEFISDKEALAGAGFEGDELERNTLHHRHLTFDGLVADYFKASDAGVFRRTSNVLIPSANVPISVINFRTGLVTLAEVGMRSSRTVRENESGFIQNTSNAVPPLLNNDRGLPAYFSLLSDRDVFFDQSTETLLLSDMPGFDIEYEYQRVGNFESNNSADTVEPTIRLQYKRIQQRILLDNQPRTLIFPSERENSLAEYKIQFAVEGLGSKYTLKNVHAGMNLLLKGDKNSSYVLEIPGADYFKEGETVKIDGGILSIRGRSQEWIHIGINDLQSPTITLTNGRDARLSLGVFGNSASA